MFRLTVKISPDLTEAVKIRAAKERRTLQETVTSALEAYLKTPLRREGGGR
jgi:predicted DNA binding CopG/RHH family protein